MAENTVTERAQQYAEAMYGIGWPLGSAPSCMQMAQAAIPLADAEVLAALRKGAHRIVEERREVARLRVELLEKDALNTGDRKVRDDVISDLRADVERLHEQNVSLLADKAEAERLTDWQNELAEKMPPEYDGDEAQEYLIDHWIDTLTREHADATAKVAKVQALTDVDALERAINSRFGTDAVHRLVAEAVAGLIVDALNDPEEAHRG